jgi:hypothetical protein
MKVPPALVLFLLAPTIGELLSGSSPPIEFFNPISFALLASLYGSGAVLIRELKTRWKKDYSSLLLLGAAYGILEEGLMVKSFFDPQWMDLGILGSFGRWMEVNWVWAEMLTIYHAVFSIAIPVILVELAFPERKNESWISRRTFAALVVLLGIVTAIGYFFLTTYRPPTPQYLLAAFAMCTFIYAAYKIKPKSENQNALTTPKARYLWLASFLSTIAFFMIFWAGPYFLAEPVAIMLLGLILIIGMFRLVSRCDWKNAAPTSKLAIVSGALSFLIILDFLLELSALNTGIFTGMSIVGMISIIATLSFKHKIQTKN